MDKTLHFQLLAAHSYFRRVFLKRIQEIYPEIMPGQPKVIDFLMYRKKAFQREIANGCLIEPATLSVILEKMERIELVHRAKNSSNNKNIVVELTEKGIEIGRNLQRIFAETEKDLCQSLSESELDILQSLLKKICDNGKVL